MAIRSYHLGCPSWGFKPWLGSLYEARSKPGTFLEQYARVFNAVEGNTTFYGVPQAKSVASWGRAVPEGFRFSFKIPSRITHEKGLHGAGEETLAFFERMAPLGARLGPFMVQLPASFRPADLPALEAFLETLPSAFRYAVELRHPAFFDGGEAEARLVEVLHRQGGVDRVILDTRALRAGDPRHPEVLAAPNRKPDLPVRLELTGRSPLVRLVCHPVAEVNTPWLESWAEPVAEWIRRGLEPHVFFHCPNDLHSPALARAFHERLRQRADVGSMPPWPGEEPGGQMRLF